MSAKTPNDQSVSDDQELAKVLAGNASQQKADVNDVLGGLQFEESPVPASQSSQSTASSAKPASSTAPTITPSPSATTAAANSSAATSGGTATPTSPAATSAPSSAPTGTASTAAAPAQSTSPSTSPSATTSAAPSLADLGATGVAAGASGSLDSIKKDALEELRPLVDKLNLPAEEKFDTLLLIIRSTDDQSLLGPAHDAAKAIQDESRRAQALLDVIKEIDYFSAGQGQA